jgi:hypothetical protein
MEKYFICLANSYKHGGRCIAGIEVVSQSDGSLDIARHDDGRPRWIRPISMSVNGEIPNHLAETFKIFSLVKLTDVEPCPDKAHTEDVHCSRMEICPSELSPTNDFLDQLIDTRHQAVFYFRGKAIPATIIDRLDYSLMLIHPDSVCAYCDEERENSKYRMKFSYYGSNYDFPITDPVFLEQFKKNPDCYTDLKDVYLVLSLGIEFEGFHFKLVATVVIPENRLFSSEKPVLMEEQQWFDGIEQEMMQLIEEKKGIEERLYELRFKIKEQMESHGQEQVKSQHFTISYTPAKTVMQFDSKSFRQDNAELYTKYCIPKQKEASIVVRQNKMKQP